jgi:hypothetical protein
VFAQWDFPLHYKNKRYVPPIKFVENQDNLGNTSVTHGMTLYRKGKCLGANSLLYLHCRTHFTKFGWNSLEQRVLSRVGGNVSTSKRSCIKTAVKFYRTN